jgi:flagellar basal-body rod protein FlgF
MATDFQPLYILASGMYYQQRKMEVVSNNLANANTEGFKKDLIAAQALEVKNQLQPFGDYKPGSPTNPSNNFIYPIVGGIKTDLSQGGLIRTSNPLDVAIMGDGFLAVEKDGKTYYTRKGRFLLDREGYLVNDKGLKVLDKSGNYIRIGNVPTSEVSISKDGSIYINGKKLATLKIVGLKDCRKVGYTLFEGKPTETKNYTVLQGYLESANVNPVREMVQLIETVRAYEAFANGLKAQDENNSKLINGVLKA